MLPDIIATLAAGLFAGAAIYIDLAEQPARKQNDIAAALTEWRPSYKRGLPWCSRCLRQLDS